VANAIIEKQLTARCTRGVCVFQKNDFMLSPRKCSNYSTQFLYT